MNAILKPALVTAGLLLGAQTQASSLVCDPQELHSPNIQSPAFSSQGPLLRMHGLPSDAASNIQPAGNATDLSPDGHGYHPGFESDSSQNPPSWSTPNTLCVPNQLAPRGQAPQQKRAPARIWL
ncbi:hypothetical protein [Marinobacterium rhizophilum]|uniref:Uncharacterized protein n=1 Tax=Marinobacterium rhizophilum TaxID=420402 RepID=A0ABY5HEC2_9GAMM|nr:hypothetical protein [Marinobacterium rhizophilum]UTW10708.1 hypothetical protein KDW95_15610 [Marinobacterium rhizophilum]